MARDTDGVFAGECAEAGEGFAESVWVAERVFEEGELVCDGDGIMDEEGGFGDGCVEAEGFEMGLEDAEEDGFFACGSGDGEVVLVRGALIEMEGEEEGGGGAVEEAEACAELFEDAIEAEEEGGCGFDGGFEGEREMEWVGKGFEVEDAFAGVAGHFPEGIDFVAEAFADVLTREGEEFSEGGEAPIGEVLEEEWREVEFGEAEGGEKGGRVFDEEDGVGAASGAEGEGGLWGDTDLAVDVGVEGEFAEGGVCPRGPIICGGVEAGEVEEPAVSEGLFFHARGEGFDEAEEGIMEGEFCGGGGGEEGEGGAACDGLCGWHSGEEAVCGGERVDFEE